MSSKLDNRRPRSFRDLCFRRARDILAIKEPNVIVIELSGVDYIESSHFINIELLVKDSKEPHRLIELDLWCLDASPIEWQEWIKSQTRKQLILRSK